MIILNFLLSEKNQLLAAIRTKKLFVERRKE